VLNYGGRGGFDNLSFVYIHKIPSVGWFSIVIKHVKDKRITQAKAFNLIFRY